MNAPTWSPRERPRHAFPERLRTGGLAVAFACAAFGCARSATGGEAAAVDPFVAGECTFVAKEGRATPAEVLHATADGAVASAGTPVGYVATKRVFSEYELTLELRWTGKPGNGGVLLALGEPAADKVWPRALQVQFKADTVGELIPMDGFPAAELKPGAKAVPRAADVVESPAGEWNRLRIVVHRDTVECWVNGTFSCRVTGCGDTAGRIGLQNEGAPWEYRRATLTPVTAGTAAVPGK